MSRRFAAYLAILVALVLVLFGCRGAAPLTPTEAPSSTPTLPANREVILATTTSTQDSGLLDVLVPIFEKRTGFIVKTIAVGTGQALAMGQRGEADVLLVHAPDAEEQFIREGHGTNRQRVMHNDFIIVGPESDPAGIKGLQDATQALRKIADKKATFLSRGDESGTHKLEKSLWKEAGIDPESEPWYQQSGQGMGATLHIASEKEAYSLTDRATYLALKKNLHLAILVEGDTLLLNVYHVMQVNPAKSDKINAEGGKAFVEFMVSPETQETIKGFGVDKYGQPLFFIDTGK